MEFLSDIEAAAAVIRDRLGRRSPRIAVVLGSGLGYLTERLSDPVTIPYGEIPGFPKTTVIGHGAELVAGNLAGKEVLAQSGRFHLYEGHDAATAAFPVRVFAALGIHTLILTNAAGGIRRTFSSGTVMLIADHINLTFHNPLTGPVLPGEERFPDMSDPYDKDLRTIAREVARSRRIALDEGVYIQLLGSQLRDAGRDPNGRPAGRRCGRDVHRDRGDRRARAGHQMPWLLGGDQPRLRHLTHEARSCRGDGDRQPGAA